MNKNFKEEEDRLNYTLDKYEEIIEDTEARIHALPKIYERNPVTLEALSKQFNSNLKSLKKNKDKPYFARIDFVSDDEKKEEEYYIGKVGAFDENNKQIVIDWRAPISSLYYDGNIGNVSYNAPGGIISGEMKLKRQYNIQNRKLVNFQDVDTVSNDEILKPYLNANTDIRLKNIVATIQREQNEIIRSKLNGNLIIQGVAGSGKTTVALHRIAYLVYNNIKTIKPEQYLVIGPNKFFVDYISGVLPDLDVDNVSQLTYEEIVKELLNEDFVFINNRENFINSINNTNDLFYEKLKVSLLFKDLIDKFLNEFDEKIVPDFQFNIKGYNILASQYIKEVYKELKKDDLYKNVLSRVNKAKIIIGKYIVDHQDEIISNIYNQFYDEIKSKSKEEIDDEHKKIEYIKKELRNGCNQSLNKYFNSNPKILNLYADFLKCLDTYLSVKEYNIKSNIKNNIKNIKSKKLEFEDLAAIMYLYYKIYGSSGYENYRHVVIDEAQDFGEFNFYSLKQLMTKASFSIFGDMAQSIYQYRSITNWNQVVETTFEGSCEIKYLKKSYRTTAEIMNSANNIIKFLGLDESEPVIRHGVDVKYISASDNQIEMICEILHKYLNNGFNSIAIICKDDKEATEISELLKRYKINVQNLTDEDVKYHGGICTIPSYLAKGLEFDGVIISNASESIYDSNKSLDMKLLYVSMTRALHELVVLYSDELVKPLQNEKNKVLKKG